MAVIELVGFQAGPRGFCEIGFEPPIDYLYLRASGGRRSGKTKAGSIRAVTYMTRYPGSWGAIVSLTNDGNIRNVQPSIHSVLKQLGMKQGTHWEFNKTDRIMSFWNGSVAVFGSAEHYENLPGADLAWFWLDEYRRMPEAVFNALQPALTQKGFPHQAWMTSTPGGKQHWSRKVFMPTVYAAEFDEPVYERKTGRYISYRALTKDNTMLPEGYFAQQLEAFGGEHSLLARQELYGEEIIMEGLVYPEWDAAVHMVRRDDWPAQPKRVLAGVDFGFRNPSAVIVYGVDEQRRRYVLDEFYRKGCSEQALIEECKRLMGVHNIHQFICDSEDPRWIAAMRSQGVPALPAKKVLRAGGDFSSTFSLCTAALNRKQDDKQAFFVDPRCVNFRREIENYVYEDEPRFKDGAERPRKKNDHCFVAGTVIKCASGDKPIEKVTFRDKVLTRDGYRQVMATGLTNPQAVVYTVYLSSGEQLGVTDTHPVWVQGKGWVPVWDLNPLDTLYDLEDLWTTVTSTVPLATVGASTTGRYPQVATSTTKTATQRTTTWQTLSAWMRRSMSGSIMQAIVRLLKTPIFLPFGTWPPCGTIPTLAESGIGSMRSSYGETSNQGALSASGAARSSTASGSPPSSATPTTRLKTFVIATVPQLHRQPVYNLTVEGTPEFFANGVLVHNCLDAWRYSEIWVTDKWDRQSVYQGSVDLKVAA